MKIVIAGGAGIIGRRLALKLLEKNDLDFGRGQGALDSLTTFDVGEPDPPFPDDPRLEMVTGDVTDPDQLRALITPDTDAVFHLAAVVSAGAEADFDLGMRVNLGGTRTVLDVCRELGTQPRLVFASSVAVFGGLVPDVIQDDTHLFWVHPASFLWGNNRVPHIDVCRSEGHEHLSKSSIDCCNFYDPGLRYV